MNRAVNDYLVRRIPGNWRWLLIATAFCCFVTATYAQGPYVARFTSPIYPPLARQANISGRVTLDLTINEAGLVTDIKERTSEHPLLSGPAKQCAREWEFQAVKSPVNITVTIYYGFSGKIVETNPTSVVRAEFSGLVMRVFVLTDAYPALPPDVF